MEKDFRQEMSAKLENLIGHALPVECIVEDETGFGYYIQDLRSGHPVFIVHFQASPKENRLYLVLPYVDYVFLREGNMDVDKYITEKHFHYGYLKADGTILGAYWRSLEEGAGIHDRELIHEQLQALKDGSIEKISGPDSRQEFLTAFELWVARKMQFEVDEFITHLGKEREIRLYAGYYPNKIRVAVSHKLLNELLYTPNNGEHDWNDFIECRLSLLRKHRGDQGASAWLTPATSGDLRQSCLNFWGSEMPSEPKLATSSVAATSGEKTSFLIKVVQFFRRICA